MSFEFSKAKSDDKHLRSLPMVTQKELYVFSQQHSKLCVVADNMYDKCMANDNKSSKFPSTEIEEWISSLFHYQKNTCVSIKNKLIDSI